MMKHFLLTAAMLCTLGVNAQTEVSQLSARTNVLQRQYLRPSVSTIFVTDGSDVAEEAAQKYQGKADDKYDFNPVQVAVSRVTVDKKAKSKEQVSSLREQVETILKKNRVGNQVMHVWFPKFDAKEKSYDIDVLRTRGAYAATDNDVLAEKASHRKNLAYDLGSKLIDRSYVIVYYLSHEELKGKNGEIENKLKNPLTLVYKLNFGDSVRTVFYENHFDKANGIENMDFPLDFVYAANTGKGVLSFVTDLFQSDNEDALEASNTIIAQHVNDLRVATGVMSTSPIAGKIGTKESVMPDRRYRVMELVLNKKGEEVSKNRATVRATNHVLNNLGQEANGQTEDMTHFYQVSGGRVSEGMTLVEYPDLGIGLTALATTNAVGGAVELRANSLLSQFGVKTPISGLLAYARFNLVGNALEGKFPTAENVYNIKLTAPFYQVAFGVGKEFNFARRFFFTPYVGYVMNDIAKPKEYEHIETGFAGIEGMGRLGFYWGAKLQFFAQASYVQYMGVNWDVVKANKTENFFPALGFGIGLKFNF